MRLNRKADGLVAFAKNVAVEGLAINSAYESDRLLRVISVADNFRAQGNWIGVSLGGAVSRMDVGIELSPGSKVATIGGTNPEDRNVIAGAGTAGLGITGASTSIIKGNYFGISGSSGAAIQVFGTEASPNEIARNHGSGDGGRFIDLFGGANEASRPRSSPPPPRRKPKEPRPQAL